jgi:hypothetical protein
LGHDIHRIFKELEALLQTHQSLFLALHLSAQLNALELLPFSSAENLRVEELTFFLVAKAGKFGHSLE